MGAALYIALEKQIPDFDSVIDGKMLSKSEKQLASAAKRLGVRPLMEFFSTGAEEAEDLLGEDVAGDKRRSIGFSARASRGSKTWREVASCGRFLSITMGLHRTPLRGLDCTSIVIGGGLETRNGALQDEEPGRTNTRAEADSTAASTAARADDCYRVWPLR